MLLSRLVPRSVPKKTNNSKAYSEVNQKRVKRSYIDKKSEISRCLKADDFHLNPVHLLRQGSATRRHSQPAGHSFPSRLTVGSLPYSRPLDIRPDVWIFRRNKYIPDLQSKCGIAGIFKSHKRRLTADELYVRSSQRGEILELCDNGRDQWRDRSH